jgi:hypothetical protein
MNILIPDLQNELTGYFTLNELVYQCHFNKFELETEEIVNTTKFWIKKIKLMKTKQKNPTYNNVSDACDACDACDKYVEILALNNIATYGTERYPASHDKLKPIMERAEQNLSISFRKDDIYLSLYFLEKIPKPCRYYYFYSNRISEVISQASRLGLVDFLEPLMEKIRKNDDPEDNPYELTFDFLLPFALYSENSEVISWYFTNFKQAIMNETRIENVISEWFDKGPVSLDVLEFLFNLVGDKHKWHYFHLLEALEDDVHNRHLIPWLLEHSGDEDQHWDYADLEEDVPLEIWPMYEAHRDRKK